VTDQLDAAVRALREECEGASPRAEKTLARLLDDTTAVRRGSIRRQRVFVAMAAVLAISSAAAASVKRLGLAHFTSVDPGASGSSARERAARPPSEPHREAEEPLVVAAARAPSASAEGVKSGAREGDAGAVTAPDPRRERLHGSIPIAPHPAASGSGRSPASREAPAATRDTPSPDDAAYARAHRLHFHAADPAAALSAWDDYLSAYPNGRFAPEAHYNRAIALLRLQRFSEARQALEPFARGDYGAYHVDQARALLQSLP
jgi:TolA-binding protein